MIYQLVGNGFLFLLLIVGSVDIATFTRDSHFLWFYFSKISPTTLISTPAAVDAKKEKENDEDTAAAATAAAAAAKAKADATARANAKLGFGGGAAAAVAGSSSGVSANAFASGSNQNSGNVMTGRPTSRVLAPPGGHCSIQLF